MNLFGFIEYAAQNVSDAYKSMQSASEEVFKTSVEDWASKYENQTLCSDSHITKNDAINLVCAIKEGD